ncbi:MAG: UDP-2,3-diacylglucosamine diphosphatase, partial [Burkholderiaceae bacterium]
VVCGHIHRPALREVDGLLYCNDGDWVESLSALGEDMEGKLVLIDGGEQALPSMLRPKHSIKLPALPSTLQRGHIRDNP